MDRLCQIVRSLADDCGKPQRYMTQYTVFDDGSIVVEPWEGDENTTNEYRAKLGLPLVPLRVVDAMKNN